MKKYLLNDSKKGYTAEVKSAYNRRVVEYARKGIEDLTLLAEKLPEEIQAKIFNKEILRPLIGSLFNFQSPELQPETVMDLGRHFAYVPTPLSEELEKKRKRIVQLCYLTLEIIGDSINAQRLAPEIMDTLVKAGLNETFTTLIGLKAVYLEGYRQQPTVT